MSQAQMIDPATVYEEGRCISEENTGFEIWKIPQWGILPEKIGRVV